MARLKEFYEKEIVDAMIKKFGYKNVMEVPKLHKIVINMGDGEAKENAKVLDSAVRDLEVISGQKAVTTKAKKSVANFKIREGMAIGCKVTVEGPDGKPMPTPYTIVGSQESDPMHGVISEESPFGKALIGKKEGETAVVEAPRGNIQYKVLKIER